MILFPQMMRARAGEAPSARTWELKTTSTSSTYAMNSACVSASWFCELPSGVVIAPNQGNPTANPTFNLSGGAGVKTIFTEDSVAAAVLCSSSFANAWRDSQLTSFPAIDLGSGTNFQAAWRANQLTSFPAIDLGSGTDFRDAWRANQLNPQSVDNILTALINNGRHGLTTHIGKDTQPLTANAQAMLNTLRNDRGWTVNGLP